MAQRAGLEWEQLGVALAAVLGTVMDTAVGKAAGTTSNEGRRRKAT